MEENPRIPPLDPTALEIEQPTDFAALTIPLTHSQTPDYADDFQEIAPPVELTAPIAAKKGTLSLSMPTLARVYIATLAQTGRHTAAIAAAGISNAHSLEFRKKHPDFQDLCDEALARFTAGLEAEVYRRAVHGVAEPHYVNDGQGGKVQVGVLYKKSDKLLLEMLKRRDPAYREAAGGSRTTVNVSAQATATASTTAPGAPPTLDTARMSRAQREAYRAFLATMEPELPAPESTPVGELAPPHPHESALAGPQSDDSGAVEVLPRGTLPARGEPASDD
jgi:hypothetical protein